MTQIIAWLKEGLLVLGLSLLVILGILLFVVLVRPLIIVGMVAMVIAFVVTLFSPRARAWLESPAHH